MSEMQAQLPSWPVNILLQGRGQDLKLGGGQNPRNIGKSYGTYYATTQLKNCNTYTLTLAIS